MDLIEKTFEEVIDFSRPVAADYLDGDGQPATAGVNVPRFTHTTEGVPLGLMVERPLRESAVIRNGGWRNPQRGTWIIRGIFDNAELMRGLGFFVDASGSGTVVITYNTTSAKVFARGALQYQTNLGPVDDFGIATENLATVARIEFYPHIFSDSRAAAAAVGAVDVMPSLVTMYHEGESGFLWDGLPYYQDPAGTTVASWGDPVGLISDDSGNGSDFTQATVTARPVLGRVPRGGRRNQLRNTDLSSVAWNKLNIAVGDPLPFGSSTLVRISRASGIGNSHLSLSSIPSPLSSVATVSCVCKMTETEGNGLFAISIRNLYPARADAVFNLITGEATYGRAVDGFVVISTATTDLGDDTYRLSLTAVTSDSGSGATSYMLGPASLSGGTWEGPSGSTGEFYVGEVQYEYGDILTTYQSVTTEYNITESGVESVHYIHLDGIDDTIATTLPAITNGTLVLAGTNGIWIDDDFNHTGGAFTVGPTTYTGGPDSILPIVGDLIVGGSFAIDRQLTTQERERVINKLESMGAGEVLA